MGQKIPAFPRKTCQAAFQLVASCGRAIPRKARRALNPGYEMTNSERAASAPALCTSQDFQEIAHSGGKIIFGILVDAEGRTQYNVKLSWSRPVPSRMFAIYALPQGIPVEDIQLGGMGQPCNPAPYSSCIPVFIASDSEGFFGHQCPNCGKYWR